MGSFVLIMPIFRKEPAGRKLMNSDHLAQDEDPLSSSKKPP
jgi:hypothetical protein